MFWEFHKSHKYSNKLNLSLLFSQWKFNLRQWSLWSPDNIPNTGECYVAFSVPSSG